jgi:hypothetical protein
VGSANRTSIVLALTLLACGGRAARSVGANNHAPGDAPSPGTGPLDLASLIDERCAGFALPAGELDFFGANPLAGYPLFGPCGHLSLIAAQPVPIYGPDLAETVVEAAILPRFSPDGTRVAFVPAAPEDDRVRRLDLVNGQSFDTLVENADPISTALGYGLFLGAAGDVQSWVCSGHALRIFADRTPVQAPLFETDVPSCDPTWTNDSTLLWLVGATITVVDLQARRAYALTPPLYGGGQPNLIDEVFDGYAAAPLVFTNEERVFGPLYSMRDGGELAKRWEGVAMADGHRAANRIDHGYSLLLDDGRATQVVPNLRGLYVFRDQRRVFALRPAADGKAELVFQNLETGEATVLAEYTSRALSETDPLTVSFGVSRHEQAAYFVLGPDDTPNAPQPTRSGVVRWLDGESELVAEAVPAGSLSPAVTDDGTAVFSTIAGSVRLRPGSEPLLTPGQIGYLLSADGRTSVRPSWDGESSRLLVMNLDSGVESARVADIRSDSGESVDVNHLRYAAAFSFDGLHTELWAGRFPVAE